MASARAFGRHIGLSAAAFLVLVLLLAGFSELVRPDELSGAPPRDATEYADAESARHPSLDADDPPVLTRAVDYATDGSAGWRPREESPWLAELVDEGLLPPVAERVGPEPLVMEGVDGTGRYGGIWSAFAPSVDAIFTNLSVRMSGCYLVRWSPQGRPVVPHLAKEWSHSSDYREYTFHLRRGVRWSDGHPFTSDDLVFWWEHEVSRLASYPKALIIADKRADFERVDEYTVRFRFPVPNPDFIERMADTLVGLPAHYLAPYLPEGGDPDRIASECRELGLSPHALYARKKSASNPECPRLWPWIYRRYKATPPYQFVRNPYYWAVDPEGRQLPYIDLLQYDVRSSQMIELAATSGGVTLYPGLRYGNYTLAMSQRERAGYEVYQWYPGARSTYTIYPNLNRRIIPGQPETTWKNRLLNERRFREALSLAINRDDIIRAVFNGQTEPAQLAPGDASPYHHPVLQRSFTAYDPTEASRLLDELGLTVYDAEGFRTYPNGTRMTFFLNEIFTSTEGPSQFVIDDWAAVGLRVRLRKLAGNVMYAERYAYNYDLIVAGGESEHFPLLQPYSFVPTQQSCFFAPGFGLWYMLGGLSGDVPAGVPGALEPPPGHPVLEAMRLYNRAVVTTERYLQQEIFRGVLDIAAREVWSIGISTPPPVLVLADKGLRNLPPVVMTSNITKTPVNVGVETLYFDSPRMPPGAVETMRRAIVEPLPDPSVNPSAASEGVSGRMSSLSIGWIVPTGFVVALLWLGWRYPFIGRRLLTLVPTVGVMSVLIFAIIRMPPGDFLSTRIMQLQMEGNDSAVHEIENLRTLFHTEDPAWRQYLRWTGLLWFATFATDDRGLLQGNLGRSMETGRPVNELIGDRLALTVLISLFTIVFTWGLALPIGIYSAVRQYSIGDYILTVVGFVGISVPGFLLAILFMYAAEAWLGISATGLFSPEFAVQPEWTVGKVVDLLKHIWLPVAVLGVSGTAGMIRVMRGNLLDELRRPYVVAARAKGVRPVRLLLKYPVRLALNPFVSGIGSIFPQLVSGGAIVAIVMSLPTVGPLLLSALLNEDMYLAGSLLMVLSVLGVLGTLVSDLLLMALDPRIRMEKGGR